MSGLQRKNWTRAGKSSTYRVVICRDPNKFVLRSSWKNWRVVDRIIIVMQSNQIPTMQRLINRVHVQPRPHASFARVKPAHPTVFSRGFATRHYTKEHEWIQLDGDVGTVGISNYAQKALGDVVFVDLPDVGKELAQKETAVSVESVKAASDVYTPASGKVTEVNETLRNEPGLVNSSALQDGWMFKLKLTQKEELKELMDEKAYEKFCEAADH